MGRSGKGSPPPEVSNEVSQPSVFEQTRLAGEEPTIVAEWEYSEFVWWSEFLTELPSGYRALLELLRVDPERYFIELSGFYAYRHLDDPHRECDVERIYLPVVRCGRYHPYASIKHRRRASQRALDRLEFLEEECRKKRVDFDYLIKIDLTLPREIYERWYDLEVGRRVHRAVRDFLAELQRELFPEHNSQLGAISTHHYWATRKPLSHHRHVHLTIPNVCYNRGAGTFHRIRPFIDHGLVERVWKQSANRNGLWFEVDPVNPDVWVGCIRFEERDRVLHRLSYCCRRPTEDLVRNLKPQDLDGVDREFASFLLNYTPRMINLGFLTDLKRFGYSRKPCTLKCPICGGDMTIIRNEHGEVMCFDRPPPEVPALRRNIRGIWERALE